MNISNRLSGYYEFDQAVLESVEDAAQYQNGLSFADLADRYQLGDGPTRVRPTGEAFSLEVLHIKPVIDYDERQVRVLQSPMGIPADNSMAMRAMRLFAGDPTVPLVVVGSPAALGSNANVLRHKNRKTVASGDLRPAIKSVLQYLSELSIHRADILGYSYGADAGAAMAQAAHEFGITTERAVLMEPAGMESRRLLTLFNDFRSSGSKLGSYIANTDCQPLFEARGAGSGRVASTVGFIRWAGGLLRPTNIAIAKGLAQGQMADMLDMALYAQPRLKLALLWGSDSEITNTPLMEVGIRTLQRKYPKRITGMMINGMHHAGGDDIDLHAAMCLQGLRATV